MTTSARVTDRWEDLRPAVGPPRPIGAPRAATPEAAPTATWWLPSLASLAYHGTERDDARAVLDEFAARRDELRYAVVEEETDQVIGLTLQPWPLLDVRGRLRFPIGEDPDQVDVRADELVALVRRHQQVWHEHGLLPAELVDRPVRIGDALAVAVSGDPRPERIAVLPHAADDPARFLGGLGAADDPDRLAVPVIDVTWDAREAGKLAHYAASAGVIGPQRSAATAPFAREAEARYLEGFARGVDPRTLPPRPEGGPR